MQVINHQYKEISKLTSNYPHLQLLSWKNFQTEERILKYSNGCFKLKFKFFSENRKWIGLHFITDDEILV